MSGGKGGGGGKSRGRTALRRFAAAITAFTVVGHAWLGFEQSWVHPVAAVVTGYALETAFELLAAWRDARPARFAGGPVAVVDFLLSAHVTGLSVALLIYPNERVLPIVFATAVAIASKTLLRAPLRGRSRHFMNPSNFGIAVTLLLFPWVGISPPYHFTENLVGAGDWILPGFIIVSGSALNHRLTGRTPLIVAWVGGFVLQAVVRAALFGTPVAAGLAPVTGVAFVLFTFYMITDPVTTPRSTVGQVAFGASVAATYGLVMAVHVVFGLFFALVIVCGVRGLALHAVEAVRALRAVEPGRLGRVRRRPLPVAGARPALRAGRLVEEADG